MANTKAALISDLELRLTASKPSDDWQLEHSQIAHWLSIYRDELVQQYLESRIKNNKPIDNYFIELQDATEILKEEIGVFTPSRYYVELDSPVLELFEDRGVDRVWTNNKQIVYKTHPSRYDVIYSLEWSRPSESNLVYYREGDKRLIIEGIPDDEIATTTIFIWYIPKQDIECLSDSDEVKIPTELIPTLLELVESKARQQMFNSVDDDLNDGNQNLPNITNG